MRFVKSRGITDKRHLIKIKMKKKSKLQLKTRPFLPASVMNGAFLARVGRVSERRLRVADVPSCDRGNNNNNKNGPDVTTNHPPQPGVSSWRDGADGL